jgi:hypothetical protein
MAATIEQSVNRSVNRPLNRPRNRAGDPFGGSIPLALVAIAVTLIGFWRTFFSKLGHVDAAHMLHGAASTGWLVLVLAQATLIRSRQFKWHRVVGWSSLLLFAVLLVTSWHVMALLLSGKGAPMPFQFAKLFIYSDVTALPLFIICYAGAIVLRKDRHVHSRLVSTTLLAGLLPALARMFGRIWTGLDGLIFSMHPTYIFVLVILAIAIFVDWKKDRLRWPFPFAFVWFAIAYATLFPGASSQWFDHLARAIAATA